MHRLASLLGQKLLSAPPVAVQIAVGLVAVRHVTVALFWLVWFFVVVVVVVVFVVVAVAAAVALAAVL